MTDATQTTVDQKREAPAAGGQAATQAPEITDFERNQFVQERREWLARYRMIDGEIRGMNQQMADARLGHTKHTLNIIGGAVRTAFNFRNPMAMIGGIFQIGMSFWDLASDKSRLGRVEMKRDAFMGMSDSHVKDYGLSLASVFDPKSKGGDPLIDLATGFKQTMAQAAHEKGITLPRHFLQPSR